MAIAEEENFKPSTTATVAEKTAAAELLSSYLGVSFAVFLAYLPASSISHAASLQSRNRILSLKLFAAEDELRQLRSRRREDSRANARVAEIFAGHRLTWQKEEKRLLGLLADAERGRDELRAAVEKLEKKLAARDEAIEGRFRNFQALEKVVFDGGGRFGKFHSPDGEVTRSGKGHSGKLVGSEKVNGWRIEAEAGARFCNFAAEEKVSGKVMKNGHGDFHNFAAPERIVVAGSNDSAEAGGRLRKFEVLGKVGGEDIRDGRRCFSHFNVLEVSQKRDSPEGGGFFCNYCSHEKDRSEGEWSGEESWDEHFGSFALEKDSGQTREMKCSIHEDWPGIKGYFRNSEVPEKVHSLKFERECSDGELRNGEERFVNFGAAEKLVVKTDLVPPPPPAEVFFTDKNGEFNERMMLYGQQLQQRRFGSDVVVLPGVVAAKERTDRLTRWQDTQCDSSLSHLKPFFPSEHPWKVDVGSTGVSSKLKLLEQELINLEKVGNRDLPRVSSLMRKQAKRYRSLTGKIDELCKLMQVNNPNEPKLSPDFRTTRQREFLFEALRLQHRASETGQKLRTLQVEAAKSYLGDELVGQAKVSTRQALDAIRNNFREIQRNLEIWLARIMGDLEGMLARDGASHATDYHLSKDPFVR